MAVRICTIDLPRFMHDGLEVGPNWTPVDKDMPEAARAALRNYAGRFIRVHPDDLGKLAELGLAIGEDGKLVDLTTDPDAPTGGESTTTTTTTTKTTKPDAPRGARKER